MSDKIVPVVPNAHVIDIVDTVHGGENVHAEYYEINGKEVAIAQYENSNIVTVNIGGVLGTNESVELKDVVEYVEKHTEA